MTTDNSNKSLSIITSEHVRKEAEGRDEDDIKLVEVLVTYSANAMSIENDAAATVHILNVRNYHQSDFLRMEHIEDPEILQRDTSLS